MKSNNPAAEESGAGDLPTTAAHLTIKLETVQLTLLITVRKRGRRQPPPLPPTPPQQTLDDGAGPAGADRAS